MGKYATPAISWVASTMIDLRKVRRIKSILTIQLLFEFDFSHTTSKSSIFDHPNIKTVHI